MYYKIRRDGQRELRGDKFKEVIIIMGNVI